MSGRYFSDEQGHPTRLDGSTVSIVPFGALAGYLICTVPGLS